MYFGVSVLGTRQSSVPVVVQCTLAVFSFRVRVGKQIFGCMIVWCQMGRSFLQADGFCRSRRAARIIDIVDQSCATLYVKGCSCGKYFAAFSRLEIAVAAGSDDLTQPPCPASIHQEFVMRNCALKS